MNKEKLKAMAAELAKGIKAAADLNQFTRMLTRITVEAALNAELTDHLGQDLSIFFRYLPDDSVRKVVWLAIGAAPKKWSIPIHHCRQAMNSFIIESGDRMNDYI